MAGVGEEVLERLYDDLRARCARLATACETGRDPVALERELRACVDNLRSVSATVKGEDRSVQARWIPKLRPLQDQLRDCEKRLEIMRNQEIAKRSVGSSGAAAAAGGSAFLGGPASAASASGAGRGFGRPSAAGGGLGGADTADGPMVVQERATVTIARDMLRTVNETSDMSAAALAELERQGQQIDRAHDNVRRLNESMDKAEEHLTGMKSIFGGLINKLRGKTKAIKLDTDIDFPVEWERGKKWEQKTMRFGAEEFTRVGSSGVARASIKYNTLNGILVTAENTFEISHGASGREAIRSPQYKQIIGLLVRKCNKPIRVLFKTGVPEFDPRLVAVPGYAPPGGFGRRGDASQLAAIEEAAAAGDDDALEDAILGQVSLGLGDVKSQALAMNQELTRQQHKLEVLEVDVDISNSRIRRGLRDIRELM